MILLAVGICKAHFTVAIKIPITILDGLPLVALQIIVKLLQFEMLVPF